MSPHVLPPLTQHASPNQSARAVRVPHLIVMHRWANPPATTERAAKSRFAGNINYMCNPQKKVSAHLVYGGSLVNEVAQLVPWDRKAWTEVDFNSVSYSIECADAIWLTDDTGKVIDEEGLQQAARIAAFICSKTGIPAIWSRDPLHQPGIVRHIDLGRAGNPNGHQCPTTDEALWRRFVGMVATELESGGLRRTYGTGRLYRLGV